MHRNTADKALMVCEAFDEDNYALGSDFIFANVLGMISDPHFDSHHDVVQLAVDGYVSLPEVPPQRKEIG